VIKNFNFIWLALWQSFGNPLANVGQGGEAADFDDVVL